MIDRFDLTLPFQLNTILNTHQSILISILSNEHLKRQKLNSGQFRDVKNEINQPLIKT